MAGNIPKELIEEITWEYDLADREAVWLINRIRYAIRHGELLLEETEAPGTPSEEAFGTPMISTS